MTYVQSVRVLGIDPGSRVTGYGVIELSGRGVRYVECGVIAPKASLPLPRRLMEIAAGLRELISEVQPRAVAVENVFHAHFPRAALTLGHARGVALLAAAEADLAVFEYPPATVKAAIVGSGRATKLEVSTMVRATCGLRRLPRTDASDALAVALCHVYRHGR